MTTDSARTHTWGCDRHKEDTYEGCASCDLEDFSELSSKLMTANARIAKLERAAAGAIEHLTDVHQKLVDWRREVDQSGDNVGEDFVELLGIAESLIRGEYICKSCGLRKDGEIDGTPDF